MNHMLDRRSFLASSFLAPLLSKFATATTNEFSPAGPTLDIHVHLFGVGEGGTGCRLSKTITDGLQFRFLVEVLRLRDKAKTLDEGYERVLTEQLKESGLTKAAILGQDAVYDREGKPDWD